jgi:enterochelin esterase family protein
VKSLVILSCCLLLMAACSNAGDPTPPGRTQDPPADDPLPFDSYADMKQHLLGIVEMPAGAARTAALDALADTLRAHELFPFVAGDSVAFLYRGDANSVTFPGDFNGWQPTPPRAERLGDTDVWVQEEVFPLDARLDYKVVRDGSIWTLDPENPRVQRSGYGDNSELRMPGYVPSPYVDRRDGVPRGDLSAGSLASARLGYTVDYQVYTPFGYVGLSELPVIYVTDGHEYADPLMGSMVVVLDNLIADGLLRPVIAVFIDPRVGGQNIRHEQYILNEDFVRCVADELVPAVDGAYRTSNDRRDRGILGTSLGGLNSAWFALRATDTFYRIAIQSPAYQAGDGAIIGLWDAAPRLDVDIFMSWGTFNDFGEHTEQFQDILDAKGYDYAHMVVNEGHSWGNWRALLDDVLLGFWPAK